MAVKVYYNIYIDNLKYYDAVDFKKPTSVFLDPIWVAKKVERIKSKHPMWFVRVEKNEITT